MLCRFFFFEQKTAYEMRISDWSSDVCSSDLQAGRRDPGGADGDHAVDGVAGQAGLGQAVLRRLGQQRHRVVDEERVAVLPVRRAEVPLEIGRAPCRERVCQYV